MSTSGTRSSGVPRNAWYVAATSDEVGRGPLSRRLLGEGVVLYRTTSGAAVVLADRCAHRSVPLSTGRVEGDDIVAAYTGFRYNPDGVCVAVPTQPHVPFGTAVRRYPVHEDGVFVWVWTGPPALARLRPPPKTPWLASPDWVSFGAAWRTDAALSLLQDNFADITHIANLDPHLAPPALAVGPPPPLQIQVSETNVSFWRDFPPAPVAPWHAELLGLAPQAEHRHREEGEFVSPGLWVDRWTVTVSGHGAADGTHGFVFTHALTPVDARSTHHVWRVSRDFAASPAATGTLRTLLERYYRSVKEALEGMQRMIDTEGERAQVDLAADAAASAVRRIMHRLVTEEQVD